MQDALARLLASGPDPAQIEHLQRLSGGANMETWSFDRVIAGAPEPLILRRLPQQAESVEIGQFGLPTEAALVRAAGEHGVPTPRVIRVLEPSDGLGEGYVMSRETGEALPQRILREERFTAAREQLARQCGEALARIHQIPLAEIPPDVPAHSLEQQIERSQAQLDEYGNVSPAHQLALNWLRDNPPASRDATLVHGDFRHGNLMIDEQGLVAVLDWELAHVGSPVEDLGYLCGNVWRFGVLDKPVGGFGDYADLLEGYRSVAGWAPEAAEMHYWEVYCALNWGIVCLTMLDMYRSGVDRSLERAAVGRRVTESELDLLLLLEDAP